MASDNTRNIIIFGQTGAGKSSLINMLGGSHLAGVSSDPDGGTPSNQSYIINTPSTIPARQETYTFWDTPGLNEGELGTVPPRKALDNLLKLTNEKGVNLIIYCVRAGRFPEILRVNYDLFWGIICGKQVPIVLVLTGLEGEANPSDWWTKNAKYFKKLQMKFDGQACVITLERRAGAYQQEVWELVQRHCAPTPYSPGQPKDIWKKLDEYTEKRGSKPGRRLCIIF